MTVARQPERPRFSGASIYNHPSGMLSFWYASEWTVQTDPGPLPSVTVIPDPQDTATHIALTVQDMGSPLQPDEHADVIEGVRAGLAQLDGCIAEPLKELEEGWPWGVEWQCTFLSGGQRCRRRARLFFSDQYQYSIVMDGSTEERYAYWQGMFEFTLLTVSTAPFTLGQWSQANDSSG
jgi:hypothetical protein